MPRIDWFQRYCDGLPACMVSQSEEEDVWSRVKRPRLIDRAPHLRKRTAQKEKDPSTRPRGRALLWQHLDHFSLGYCGKEPQQGPDCTSKSYGATIDCVRACDILIRGDEEKYYLRTASEPIYGMRGTSRGGMSPGRAAQSTAEIGILARMKYDKLDLSKYNYAIGQKWGGRGIPEAVQKLMRAHAVVEWVKAGSLDDAKDLLDEACPGVSGQQFGFQKESDKSGVSVPGKKWNHCMSHFGYDDTEEFYPTGVFFVPNTWAKWNSPAAFWPKEYGPWVPGISVVREDIYEEYFLNSSTRFALGVKGYDADLLESHGFNY